MCVCVCVCVCYCKAPCAPTVCSRRALYNYKSPSLVVVVVAVHGDAESMTTLKKAATSLLLNVHGSEVAY